MRRIKIFDTTLRDGEQSPGIALRPDEKAEIARALELLGVDVDRGRASPPRRPATSQGVAAVVDAVTRATVASLARTTAGDIDAAAAGARRRAAPPHPRLHRDERAAHGAQARPDAAARCSSASRWSVAYAAERADEVEFSAEDATRSDRAFLAGGLPRGDRGGRDDRQPARHGRLHDAGRVRRGCSTTCASAAPSSADVELSVHCHDDLGLAVANSLAGVEAGATQVECTVNGIGERAGNAALEEVVMALRVRADRLRRRDRRRPEHDPRRVGARRRADGLRRAAQQADRRRERVRARGRHPPGRDAQGRVDVPDHRPVRARRRDDAAARQALRPPRVHAARATTSGRTLDADELDAAFRRFKQLADTGAPVSIDDVLQEVRA